MATWKKVIVSGSSAELSALKVDNLTSGQVVIGGGSAGNLSTTAINGTGNILATTGATGVSISGSFNGTLTGTATTASYVLNAVSASFATNAGTANTASYVLNAVSASYAVNASSATTATSASFASSGTGNFTGSFSGSFFGDGSGLSGVAASFPVTQKSDLVSTDKFFINDGASKFTTYGDLLSDLAGTNLAVESTDSLTLASTITGITSISAASFSGSFSGSFQGDGSNLTGIATVLAVSGSTGNGTINLKTQALSIVGTANEIETSVSGQTVTIGLPNNVTVGGNLIVNSDLTVLGTASFQETLNLQVADRFVLFASGSNSTGDGGIVVQQATQNVGELFGFDSATTRWGVTSSFNASSPSYVPDAFMAAAVLGGTGVNAPTAVAARYQAKGNLFIGDDETIWIYS